MMKKLVIGAGCVVLGTCLPASGAIANRGTSPPKVPPTSRPPADEVPPDLPAPPESVSPPSEAASPPAAPETPVLTPVPPEPPPVDQDVEAPEEENSRVFAGAVTDPPLPAPPVRPAPVRLPFTGAGDDALPLAGVALALGGLAIMASPPARPLTPSSPVGLVHSGNAATTPSGSGGGGDRRRSRRRLWRRR